MSQSRPEHYAPAAKWLHWIMALCVLAVIPVGIVMHNLKPGPLQNQLYDLHRSTGFLILFLAILRIVVRVQHGAPTPYAGLTRLERIASTAVHHTLYLCLFALPLIGWIMTSAFGARMTFFWLFDMPAITPKNEALFKVFQRLHFFGAIVMTLAIMMHIAGALMHTFVKRDVVLWRMLPRNWS